MGLFSKIFGSQNDRELKKLFPIADKVEALADKYSKLNDLELKGCTDVFKERLQNGESLNDILPDAFACVREASTRVLGLRHYPVQIIGGIVLHQGRIAEMCTGEGKTLTATLPCYLNALVGKGVHVVTVNEYLAKRDAEWMGNIYRFLGMSVGVIIPQMSMEDKRHAYNCDITYCTNNELGFDYLRDNMQTVKEGKVQRELNFAIVDEVDSILIDEARTPLIISQNPNTGEDKIYKKANTFVRTLNTSDYDIDEKDNAISLSDSGITKAERFYGIPNIGEPENIEIFNAIATALRANYLMKKDVDYVVVDKEIVIVDEFTGRLMIGRRYRDGLHQAIEVKEGVPSKNESKTVASITFQNLFRLYGKLSGMTGTAKTEETEFRGIYYLDVVCIPTNKPLRRIDEKDHLYKTIAGKNKAVVNLIKECYKNQRPVLVGTVSVEKSVEFSMLLDRERIPHNILNAKNHEKEASIIAQAGRLGQVTIATNMAGRGTDILLGGNPEFIAKQKLAKENKFSAEVVETVNSTVDNTLLGIVFMEKKCAEIIASAQKIEDKEGFEQLVAKLKIGKNSKEYLALCQMLEHSDYSLAEIEQAFFPEYDTSGINNLIRPGIDPYYLTAKFIMCSYLNYEEDYVESLRYLAKVKKDDESQLAKDKRLYESLYKKAKQQREIINKFVWLSRQYNRFAQTSLLLQKFATEHGFEDGCTTESVNADNKTLLSLIEKNVIYYAQFSILNQNSGITLAILENILSQDKKTLDERQKLVREHYDKLVSHFTDYFAAVKAYPDMLVEAKRQTDAEKQEVVAKGGLMIIGTERHDSRRIDNQLRGRAGRQGDPGQSTFFISTEDDLCRVFGGERLYSILDRLGQDEDTPISNGMISNAIERAQLAIEERHYSMRKNVLAYDEVMNKQREVIYSERNKVLMGEDVHDQILGYIPDAVAEIVNKYADLKVDYYEWKYDDLNKELEQLLLPKGTNFCNAEYAKGFDVANLVKETSQKVIECYENYIDYFNTNINEFRSAYKNPSLGSFDDIERFILLSVVDKYWMQQIDDMDALRQGIGLRAYGQKDPVIAYNKEGYDLFEQMIASIAHDTVVGVFQRTKATVIQKTQTSVKIKKTVGRNDPCPCGSGKKFKNCHGKDN